MNCLTIGLIMGMGLHPLNETGGISRRYDQPLEKPGPSIERNALLKVRVFPKADHNVG